MNDHLDLTLSRFVDLAPALIWRAWTEPQLLVQWFTPAPWRTLKCELDLRPGGNFRTVMASPEGEQHHNEGCYLEVIPERSLSWTNTLEAGFRPTRHGEKIGFPFTAKLSLSPEGQGTRYVATVLHRDAAGCRRHAEMGFEAGWSAALGQLVSCMQKQV
jgi:uncharacterized protein YndB with AHSA1/START domain